MGAYCREVRALAIVFAAARPVPHLVPRGDHVFQRVPGGILVPVLARDADPTMACRTVEVVGVHVDHQCDPIPTCAILTSSANHYALDLITNP
jgi:hypothetical protein